jgi:hypothetical protein
MKRPYLVRRQLRFVCKLFLGGYLFLWCLPIFGQNQENENQGRFRYLEIEGHSGGYLYSGPTWKNRDIWSRVMGPSI